MLQELQDRTPVLQKQREDLDRAVEENKVLKSRYDNILEVGIIWETVVGSFCAR